MNDLNQIILKQRIELNQQEIRMIEDKRMMLSELSYAVRGLANLFRYIFYLVVTISVTMLILAFLK